MTGRTVKSPKSTGKVTTAKAAKAAKAVKVVKLTAKQEMFCQEYLIDLNATQAAIRAGYSAKTANVIGPENLAKPCIAELIVKAKAERIETVKIDAAYVLTQAKKLHERCMQEERVMVDGVVVGDYKFEHTGAAKGLEIIGKHIDVKAFDNSLDVNVKSDLASMIALSRGRVNDK